MPKGQKIIEWTAENDARLLLTILAVENIHPNCEAVAAAFGKSYPAYSKLAIIYLLEGNSKLLFPATPPHWHPYLRT